MNIRKVTILEFAPTADEIWCISRHSKDGYTDYNAEQGLISILDTAHGAKPRPEILAIYAGGKATNVARVLDRLIGDVAGLSIELVTFLPPSDDRLKRLELGSINSTALKPSTIAGIYVQLLQAHELSNVKPRFEIVDELRETIGMQTTRRCIEITLKESAGSMNFSPRIIWSPESAVAVISRVREIVHGSDMVVIAGAPPTWKTQQKSDLTPENFHANIISSVDPNCAVSIDVRGYYLHECLMAKKQPRFVFMNKEEFYEAKESWKQLDRNKSNMTLLVHDKKGCWVWDKNLPDERLLLSRDLFLRSMPVKNVHSTIGAGDAMHAGFLKEWICTENDRNQLRRSIVFSQVVASASVSNIKATHGIDANTVETEFQKVWQGTQR